MTGKEALEQCVEILDQTDEETPFARTCLLLRRFILKTLSPPPAALREP